MAQWQRRDTTQGHITWKNLFQRWPRTEDVPGDPYKLSKLYKNYVAEAIKCYLCSYTSDKILFC